MPDHLRALSGKLAVLSAPDCDGIRVAVPTLSPMTRRHTLPLEVAILPSLVSLPMRDRSGYETSCRPAVASSTTRIPWDMSQPGCETCGDSYLGRIEPINSSKVTMALIDVFGIERNL